MLSHNLKTLRMEKGLSQEELAARLNVVRQTVSKWEKGLSVPDSELLVQLAEVLEVPVSTLLGEDVIPESEKSELAQLAEKLENLNALMAERNARSRTITRIVAVCLIVAASVLILSTVLPSVVGAIVYATQEASVGIIGGADGPTAIFVTGTSILVQLLNLLLPAALLAVGIILLRKNRK